MAIHKQVQKQLEYLKSLVDAELKDKENHNKWGIPFEYSRTYDKNLLAYNEYKREIDRNGDENLLVFVTHKRKVYPFARSEYNTTYFAEHLLVHWLKSGTGTWTVREDELDNGEIIDDSIYIYE